MDKLAAKNICPEFIEALCAHEVLRSLGYLPDEIFVQQTDAKQLLVVLEHDKKKFVLEVVDTGTWSVMSDSDFAEYWSSSVLIWNSLDKAEASMAMRQSKVRTRAVQLISALIQKGMYPPRR